MLKRISLLLCCLVPGAATSATFEINSGADVNGYCNTTSDTTPASNDPTVYFLAENSGIGYCRAFDGIGGHVGMSQFDTSVTGFIIGLGNGGDVFNANTVDLYTTVTNSVSVERYRAGVLVGTEAKAVVPNSWTTITLSYTNVDRVWIKFAEETAYANRFDLTAYVPPGATVSAISGTTSEAGGTATFTVVLDSQPTADVTIGLSSSDTTEGTVAPSSLTFTNANWNTPQTVTVTGVDDAQVDGSIVYSIVTAAAVSADGAYNGFDASDVAVTNADNDTAGITVSTISGSTSESGTSATFSVVLNTQPSSNVVVGLTSNDTTEGTVAPASLTFTSANWSIGQTATVTGVDDSEVDGDISYSIVTAAAVSADGDYSALDPIDVNVTNTDDDVAGTDSNGDGILDSDAARIGLEVDAANGDTDGDGISDVAEVGDPNNPTDSDGDGVIDALEPGTDNSDATVVSAFVTDSTAQALNLDSLGGAVLSIRNTGGGTLNAHPNGNRGIPLYNETDMLVPDAGFAYPSGLMDYSVTAPDGVATVVIQLPAAVTIPVGAIVRKLDASNQWRTVDAAIDRAAGTVTLALQDNDAFDRDPTVGVIRDPVGIAVYTGGGGGGGGCVLATDSNRDLSMLLLGATIILIGGGRRHVRRRTHADRVRNTTYGRP